VSGHDAPAAETAPARRSLLGNFLSLSISTWGAQAVNFLVIVYVARTLGAGALGQLTLAQAIVIYFRFVADMGFDTMGSRRVAADRRAVVAAVVELTACRLANAAAAGSMLVLVALAAGQFLPIGWLLLLFGLSLVPGALSLEWAFMGLERMDLVGLARFVAAAVWLLIVAALVRGGTPLSVVPLAYLAGQACGAAILFLLFRRAHGRVRVRFDRSRWAAALRQAAPIGLSFIVIQVYVGFGLVALGMIEGDRAAGLYAAPQRLVLFLTSASSMFGAALYPRLAALRAGGGNGFERLVRLGLRTMVLASVPVAVGGMLVASPLVGAVYGPGYQSGAAVFRWLVPSVAPIFVDVVLGYALLAAGGERLFFRASIAAAVVNVAANLALIPRLHLVGPAVATLLAEGVVMAMLVAATRPLAPLAVGRTVVAAAASAALMAAAITLVRSAPVAVQILVGASAYLAGVAALKGLTSADLAALRDLARSSPRAPEAVPPPAR
jgi:O-antigen/teichoic acid export membrane protein